MQKEQQGILPRLVIRSGDIQPIRKSILPVDPEHRLEIDAAHILQTPLAHAGDTAFDIIFRQKSAFLRTADKYAGRHDQNEQRRDPLLHSILPICPYPGCIFSIIHHFCRSGSFSAHFVRNATRIAPFPQSTEGRVPQDRHQPLRFTEV